MDSEERLAHAKTLLNALDNGGSVTTWAVKLGDAYLERIRFHSRNDGAMAEQWDRHTGYHISADELTWSHASFITAMRERKAAKKSLGL
jgi:glucoamylase